MILFIKHHSDLLNRNVGANHAAGRGTPMIIAKHTLHGRNCDAELPESVFKRVSTGANTLSSVFRCKNLVRSHFK